MKFLADVNITQTVITFLRHLGHEVLDIKKQSLEISDIEIIDIALKKDMVILTHDKDFEALVQFPKYRVGLIAIRLKKQDAKYFCERLRDLLEKQSEELLKRSMTLIKEEGSDPQPYNSF